MGNKIIEFAKDLSNENPGNDWMMKRAQVVSDYCEKKGWPIEPGKLSFEQILEIRATQEWIDAGK